MYNVFTDFHHASLLNSLIMLFEGRLGGHVYRPIGTEWHTQGYWKIYDHPATVEQFLGINGATPDGTPLLNEVEATQIPVNDKNQMLFDKPQIFHCHDIETGGTNKAITFDGFMSMDFDIVIASIPQHIEPFRKLCELHPNKPKLIFQVGNQWVIEAGNVPNVMASAKVNFPAGIHAITYHQEFDTTIFSPDFDMPLIKQVSSFVNCFDVADIFKMDWFVFEGVEKMLPDWNFKALGGQCRDGAAHGSKELAAFIKDSRFVWHTKTGGDGYGHIVHNAAACARPLIVRKAHYFGKLAEPLMIDGKTCIAIDGLNSDQIKNKIEHYSQHDEWLKLSHGIYDSFKANVDFEAEFVNLKQFLLTLK